MWFGGGPLVEWSGGPVDQWSAGLVVWRSQCFLSVVRCGVGGPMRSGGPVVEKEEANGGSLRFWSDLDQHTTAFIDAPLTDRLQVGLRDTLFSDCR